MWLSEAAAIVYDLTDYNIAFDQRDAQLAELRRTNPVAWDEANGWWYITRHADVTAVSRDTATFSSANGVQYFAPIQFSIATLDPPEHTGLRRLIAKQFTPRMVKRLANLARHQAEEGIDRMLTAGGGNFVDEVAVPMTLSVIMHILGIGTERLREIRGWTDDSFEASGNMQAPDMAAKAAGSNAAMREHLSHHIEEKLKQPADDILSLVATDSEHPLAGEDLLQFAWLLLVAGNETTRHTSSFGIKLLAEYPEAVSQLRENPELTDSAAREILRWTSVIRSMCRTATRDVEIGGNTIHEGDLVNMIYISANRDEDVFDNPYEFNITRRPNPHLAFGIGTHYCLGASLAQMQLGIVMDAWLRKVGNFSVGDIEHFNSPTVTGLSRVEVTF